MSLSPEMEIELNDLEILGAGQTVAQDPLVVNTSLIPSDELVIETVALDPTDIAELRTNGTSRSYATVQHTRAYHHIAALKLASGEKAGVVAASLNLQPSTISRLLAQPQFQELVEGYRQEFVNEAVDTFQLMRAVSAEAVSAIHEKLIGEERGSIPLEALRRIGETFADRTGHSPIRRSEALNFNASGSISDLALERIKKRHGEDNRYQAPVPLQADLEKNHEKESSDLGAKGSITAIFKSVEEPKALKPSSEGEGV